MPLRLRPDDGVETLDRRRKVLTAGLIGLALAACAGQPVADLRAAAWIAKGSDPVDVLTHEPAACLAPGAETNTLAREGEALFNSPLLLGGQAANAGLSCAACHRNGRGNPDFALGALPGSAGHADVTDAFLGPARADGIDNPVAIPDLADAGARKIPRDAASLAAFIEVQLTEEFEAAPAAPETLAALAAYVAAIDPSDCPPRLSKMSYAADLDRAKVALDRSSAYSATSPAAEDGLRLAARAALGRLHERYPFRDQASLRADLTDMSRRIGAGDAAADLAPGLAALETGLAREAARSLYDPETLRRVMLN